MISVQTQLHIKDNTGIKKGQCIKVYKGKAAKTGDIILISVKKLRKLKKEIKFKKGEVLKAMVIQTKYKTKSTIDNYIKFDENSVIILNNQLQPASTRITTPITNQLRKRKQFKILSLASNII